MSPARSRSPRESKLVAEKPKTSSTISTRAWLLLLTTYFAYVSIYCARKPFAVAKSSIKRDLSISNQALGNIDTALLKAATKTAPTKTPGMRLDDFVMTGFNNGGAVSSCPHLRHCSRHS